MAVGDRHGDRDLVVGSLGGEAQIQVGLVAQTPRDDAPDGIVTQLGDQRGASPEPRGGNRTVRGTAGRDRESVGVHLGARFGRVHASEDQIGEDPTRH